MKILGIETSCDETAASIVENGNTMLSNVVFSSMDLHTIYGGVVPEIAARSHIEVIMPVINSALTEAKCDWDDIDGIAVTYGSGLGGSLLIGVMTARTLAITKNKPLYACNHVMGHVYANFLTGSPLEEYKFPDKLPEFPLLALIVSGNHCQLALFEDYFTYQLLGRTQDDAIGEAFDKVSKILGLGYPGGPAISKIAEKGDPHAFDLPIARVGKYDFSFSGLKTAVLRLAQAQIGEDYRFPSIKLAERLSEAQKADIAASFQRVAIQTVVSKAKIAFEEFGPTSFIIAGGVAANGELRRQLQEAINLELTFPDFKLCTDNGAMVATLGSYMKMHSQPTADPHTLDIQTNLSM
jgi:N6-L-threonylcarbamoyladenine synthase